MTALDAMKQAIAAMTECMGYMEAPTSVQPYVQTSIAITALRAAIAEMENYPKIPKNELPERIYLQVSDDDSSDWYGEVVWKEVTWSHDQIHTSDLVFIRQDLITYPATPKEKDK